MQCHSRDISLACLQETHLKEEEPAPRIRGYIVVARQDREDGYGGTITYAGQDICSKILENHSHSTARVQICTVKLRSPRRLLNVSNIYAAPGWLPGDTEWLTQIPEDGILLGDVNAIGTWDTLQTTRTHDHILEEKLLEMGFEVLNDGSTTRSSSNPTIQPSAIDITAASSQWARLSSWNVDETPTTDHHSITTTLHVKSANALPRRRRWAPEKANWDKYRDILNSRIRTQDTTCGSIESMNTTIASAILYAASRSVPKGNKPKEVPWWNETVELSVRKCKQAWKQFLSSKTEHAKKELELQQAETNSTIRKAKRDAWQDTVRAMSASDGKALLWRVLKGIDRGRKPFTPRTLKGIQTRSETKMADRFLQKFISSSKKQGKETTNRNAYRAQMDNATYRGQQQALDFFSMAELDAAIGSMESKKAGGPDDIQICFIKELPKSAKEFLLCLYNRSYVEGVTPTAWRKAEMVAIEKPGRPHEFRPISLTNVLARCMERLILTRLSPWIESILPYQQAGFRRHRSCEEQIAILTEDIAQAMYKKQVGIALLLDYSGAYDRVSIKGLLAKLGMHDCPPQLLLWLRSFLTDRRAYCRWGESKCKSRVLPCGLPQGSSLSCLLWDAYILDLPDEISTGKLSLFADDTSAWVVRNTFQECLPLIQDIATKIEHYCTRLWIKINPSKTVVLPFGNKRWNSSELVVNICGSDVAATQQGRFLGVLIDSKLTFTGHAQTTTEKYLRRCRLMASLSGRTWGADEHILGLTRKSLLEPIAKYACGAWVPHASETTLQKLERARNVPLRLQTGCCKPSNVLRLRELTATDPLREEATKSAAILLERNARLHQSTSLLHHSGTKKRGRTKRSTSKEAGETRLAQLGILPLGRLPFPVPRSNEAIKPLPGSVKFPYTNCTKSDPDGVRLRKAQELLTSLERCDVEIWTDGSVGNPTVPYPANQPWPISVRWDEKWYTATSTPLADTLEALQCVIRYRQKHNEPPSHVLFYDDGDTHAVHFRTSLDQTHVVDEDGDSLLCHKPAYHTAGGSGCIIYDHRRRTTTKHKTAAGLVCTPFSAELRAAICAFEHALTNPYRNAHYRWIVDCQGVCTALSRPVNQDNTLLNKLHQLITTLVNRTRGSLDIVWASSHCGLQGNEEADELAKLAVQLPLRDQLTVPVEFHDAKAIIRGVRKKNAEEIKELPATMREAWPRRLATVVLNQLYTGCSTMFQPLRGILQLGTEKCRHCDKEDTVAHFFTCAGRARSRRAHFKERVDWRTRILEKPLQILGYLVGEGEPELKGLFGSRRN